MTLKKCSAILPFKRTKEKRREWDSNPCGPEGPRALKARALTTLPSRHRESTVLVNCVLNVYRVLVEGYWAKVLNLPK